MAVKTRKAELEERKFQRYLAKEGERRNRKQLGVTAQTQAEIFAFRNGVDIGRRPASTGFGSRGSVHGVKGIAKYQTA